MVHRFLAQDEEGNIAPILCVAIEAFVNEFLADSEQLQGSQDKVEEHPGHRKFSGRKLTLHIPSPEVQSFCLISLAQHLLLI